ncbi:MAG: hypothetical protein HY079_08810, partial [Elusimicrobia bacterium]|nr:hypothetical protein [Elusimicrobiota bacterium]
LPRGGQLGRLTPFSRPSSAGPAALKPVVNRPALQLPPPPPTPRSSPLATPRGAAVGPRALGAGPVAAPPSRPANLPPSRPANLPPSVPHGPGALKPPTTLPAPPNRCASHPCPPGQTAVAVNSAAAAGGGGNNNTPPGPPPNTGAPGAPPETKKKNARDSDAAIETGLQVEAADAASPFESSDLQEQASNFEDADGCKCIPSGKSPKGGGKGDKNFSKENGGKENGESTGRTEPKNLNEKLAMEQAKADPSKGQKLPINLNDPRWPSKDGWVKMSMIVNGIEVHYNMNTVTGATADFKFK